MKPGYEYKFPEVEGWSEEKLLQAYQKLTATLVDRQKRQGWPVLDLGQFVMVHSLPECRVVSLNTGKTTGSGWADSEGELPASLLVLRCQTHEVNSAPYEHVWGIGLTNPILARFPLTR